ncbi:hypothetical protein SE19_05135 [Acidiplasma aeolicum]|jgi:hypothetical protein|uniref:Uncharacterized protein n=2 Tax=Acidiplasma TaxID=507753 RepID=A0A0Q0VTQ2_9ARCH|nr:MULTISPECIES: hypothetical protein [Acidiplasma]KPV46537.1 hypothetical protein SE19_05135 [Acidiplasma aeolicum]KQB34959.1 hypothetical protein AOG55_08510 [Acidiplasma cupricumulans]KQB35496.1 hypothetical protein AOG54_08850 [Acidiplasma aeolicum]
MYGKNELLYDIKMLQEAKTEENINLIVERIRRGIENSDKKIILDLYETIPENLMKYFRDLFPFC